jgi:hypothetical protein
MGCSESARASSMKKDWFAPCFLLIVDSGFFAWILTAALPIEEKWMTTKER